MVAVLCRLPDVPVMVTVLVPTVAVALAVKVNVLVPLVLAGLKDAVTPLGRPDAASETVPENPVAGFTVMVLVPVAPCVRLMVAGAAERVNDDAVTVRDSLAVLIMLPEVPVMVTVEVPAAAVEPAVRVSVLVV